MKELFVDKKEDCYSNLFGNEPIKGLPFYSYAEHLFYCGMSQMVKGYNGGYFDFIDLSKIKVTGNIDVKKIAHTSFIPIINSDEIVNITTPYSQATLSLSTACLIVWFFVLEQLANKSKDNEYKDRIINCYHDSMLLYSSIDVFKSDLKTIYKLTD